MNLRAPLSCMALAFLLLINLSIALRVRSQSAAFQVRSTNATKADEMSRPLRELRPIRPRALEVPKEAEPVRLLEIRRTRTRNLPNPAEATSFVQTAQGQAPTTQLLSSFEGVGKDVPFFYGSNTDKFRVRVAPPDTNGAVGDTRYIQWVNASFAVFDKQSGKVVYGPAEGRTIWQNFDGGACENNNDGDPIVQYDKINKRWLLAQFAISNKTDPSTGEKSLGPPYTQCVAVSETSDALGKYRRFSF